MSALLQRLIAQRAELSTNLTNLLAIVEERAATGGDDHLTEVEAKNLASVEERAKDLDEQIAHYTAIEKREADAAAIAVAAVPSQGLEQRAAGGARVTSEATVYNERGKNSWVLDQLLLTPGLSGMGGLNAGTDRAGAEERRERYARELQVEQRELHLRGTLLERDTTTTAYSGLVPPEYLLNWYAELLRAKRPTANICLGLGLPDSGMSMVIPRATAGTTVSTQATQGTAPTTTDMAVTDLTVPINTFQGRAVLSRQAIERGGVDLDRLTFRDLAADAARYLDQQVLNGSGASGNATGIVITGGILTVTQTGTTGIDSIKAIANALSQIATANIEADVIVMHPRRWHHIAVSGDTTNRPLLDVNGGGMNIFGAGAMGLTQGVVGKIHGIPVVIDGNVRTNQGVGTNQDEIIVASRENWLLWENAIREFTFEQPVGPHQVQLALYGNHAFTAARYPAATCLISGVGLVPPTFT